MKDFFVVDAPKFENKSIVSFFALASIQVRDGKKGSYLALVLADKSGSLEGRMWDNFDGALSTCPAGSYVKVEGAISRYAEKFQINVKQMRLAKDSEVIAADYLPATTRDIDVMWSELRARVNGFKQPDLKRLVNAFLDDESIAKKFKYAPAAKLLHHARIGGLLEHVSDLLKVCEALRPFYEDVMDFDLVMTGAILHDIGKIEELEWKSAFNYTLEGQLIGHISIGMGMLREKVKELGDFPDELRILVEHLILSHHGKYEFGSPKLPMIPEAMLFSMVDDLEAKTAAVRAEFQKQINAGAPADAMTEKMWALDNRQVLNTKRFLEGVSLNDKEAK